MLSDTLSGSMKVLMRSDSRSCGRDVVVGCPGADAVPEPEIEAVSRVNSRSLISTLGASSEIVVFGLLG